MTARGAGLATEMALAAGWLEERWRVSHIHLLVAHD